MTCDECTALICDDRDFAEMTRAERTAIIAHLCDCQSCRDGVLSRGMQVVKDDPEVAAGISAKARDLAIRDMAAMTDEDVMPDLDKVPDEVMAELEKAFGETPNPDANCECSVCARIRSGASPEEALLAESKWRDQMIKEHGYAVHYVGTDACDIIPINCHTHGLEQTYGHPDLQIVAHIPPQFMCGIFETVVEAIKGGTKFSDGDYADNFVGGGHQVKFVAAQEDDRTVLRIILPDKAGHLEPWDLEEPWDVQYEMLKS